MLSYQHIYHAGNFADVHKHAILLDVIGYLQKKKSPITFYDTHGGRGWYQFDSPEAQKTREFEAGILTLQKASDSLPDPVAHYLDKVEQITESDRNCYPGSPLLIADAMRDQDYFHTSDAHPGEIQHLEQLLYGVPHVSVHQRDGYEMLRGLFPPKTPRAVVIIDPAYEEKPEYQWVAKAVRQTLKIWQKAVILIWYPLLPANNHMRMIDQLRRDGIDHILRNEIVLRPPEGDRGMYGSGMLVVNPPYQLAKDGAQWTDTLAKALSPKATSTHQYYSSDPV